MGLAAAFRRFLVFRMSERPLDGIQQPCGAPSLNTGQQPDDGRSTKTFGSTLTELRCALACFDLVDEILHAVGAEPTERDRLAYAHAEWSLACAAGRAESAYRRAIDETSAP